MGWYRRTSTFVNFAFRFYKSRNTLHSTHTHKPNSESIRTKPFSSISKFSQPNVRNIKPIQESLSRTKPFSKISKLSQSILRNRNPVQESISIPKPSSKIFQSIIRNRNTIQKSIHTSRIPQFSQSILRNINLHNGLKQKNPFLDGAKRFHHHCMARSNKITLITKQRKRWYDSDALLVSMFLIASAVLFSLCFGNLETVPYSKRTHVVLLARTLEKYLGKELFEIIKEGHEGKLLAPDHPNSIRVHRISQALIEAVKKGLSSKEHIVCSSDLESFEWEVIVVDKPVMNAICYPGGKIVVYTRLLSEFEDDAEVAMIIGHEVGHAVARHSAERLLKMLWSVIVKMILWQFMDPTLSSNFLFTFFAMLAGNTSDTLFRFFVTLPFSRRNEMEADYIGMLLAASAGYDPRVAPKVFEKLGELSGSTEEDYLCTHPWGKKRAEKLSQAEVMSEALSIYTS